MGKRFLQEGKVYQQLLLLQANDEFMADVSAIRKKIESYSEVVEENGLTFTAGCFESLKYDEDIKDLRKKYNLGIFCHWPLKVYIAKNYLLDFSGGEGSFLKPRLIPEIEEPYSYENKKTGEVEVKFPNNWGAEQFVAVEIFPETTLNDFISNWDEIAKERDRLYRIYEKKSERTMKSKKLERDLYIYELKRQGLTAKEIVKKLKEKDKFKNEIVGYDEVAKIIKRLKEKADKIVPRKIT